MNDTTNYSTPDMGLAAALMTAGFKIEGLEKIGDKKFEFIFSVSRDDADAKDAISSYWDKKLLVSAYDYFNNTKMLKSRIYSA